MQQVIGCTHTDHCLLNQDNQFVCEVDNLLRIFIFVDQEIVERLGIIV